MDCFPFLFEENMLDNQDARILQGLIPDIYIRTNDILDMPPEYNGTNEGLYNDRLIFDIKGYSVVH